MKLVSLFCSISMNMNTFWKKFKFTVVAAVMLISRERKNGFRSRLWLHRSAQDGAYCYASLDRRLHVMSVEDEVHEEVTSQKSWMHEKLFAIKKLHSTLSLVSIHYNESQANLRVDDDDVHFQRWLLELLVIQLSASISPMIMAAIKYSCGR